MDAKNIAKLLLKRLQEGLTDAENATLNAWLETSRQHSNFAFELEEGEALVDIISDSASLSEEVVLEQVVQRIREQGGFIPELEDKVVVRSPYFFSRRWWVAASVVFLLGLGALFWYNQNETREESFILSNIDLQPGSEGAILTLSDGRTLILDSLQNGVIVSENGSEAVLKDGTLAYDVKGEFAGTPNFNTIATPNGRQFAVTLPDGTKVWLNAASSVRYPTVFNGHNRVVAVTGEVYMEVAPDKKRPFIVNTNDMEVQVLGTSFNINAYNDEPSMVATLLTGSIKVLKPLQPVTSVVLEPRQQAIVQDGITLNKDVDVEQIIAWKQGVFNLNGATLESFMRQIARWYDLEVIYQGAIPHKVFKGKIGRDLKLSQILKVLTLYNIKYQLSERTITITST